MEKHYNSDGKLSFIIENKFYRSNEVLHALSFETSMIVGPDLDDPLIIYGVCFIIKDSDNKAELFLDKNARDAYLQRILAELSQT